MFLDPQCIVGSQEDVQHKNMKQSSFMDTHREKWPSNETLVLTKSTNMGIWVIGWYNKSTLYKRFLNWNKIFKKQSSYWQNSILCDSICLYIGSDIAVLYGNGPFSILVLSTKKWNSSFLKTVFVLQKICLKLLKTFKILTDCHIKTYWSLKRRAPLKIPGTVF